MEYHFINKRSKKLRIVNLKISEYDAFKKKNPNLERYHATAPAISFNGRTFGSLDAQTDGGWKEVLSKIAENNPMSPLADRYGKKTIKQSRTRDLLDKHRKKQAKFAEQNARRR